MKGNTGIIVGLLIGLIAGAGIVLVVNTAPAPQQYVITTAGSTTLYPLSQQWATKFHEQYSQFTVNPATGGSGLGQSQVAQKLIHIGASSSYPDANYRGNNTNVRIIPVSADALGIVANPSVNGSVLRLDCDMAVAIFQRNVTTWEQFETTFGVSIAATGAINVYVRSDASGTTATFGKWLKTAGANPNPHANYTWLLGDHESITWVSGTNAVEGNPGVASGVASDPNGIGYVGLAFMEGLTPAKLYNPTNHEYVDPSIENALKALPPVLTNPGANLFNSANAGAYPIARLLYYLVHIENVPWYVLVFMNWALAQGQKYISEVGYVPINGTSVQMYSFGQIAQLAPTA
ncbi:MAG: PstS family phosphate ABC transporter substrate-binding protein [Candidatus Thorarchaeota archaeon]|nr:PstS family phosphate ABC transporter substrate-binding protein [Candidatus Thorarchaeota archaeon]